MSTASSPTTIVFPGQGSQRAGMGRDFDAECDASRRVYDEASDALGLDLRRAVDHARELVVGEAPFAHRAIVVVQGFDRREAWIKQAYLRNLVRRLRPSRPGPGGRPW